MAPKTSKNTNPITNKRRRGQDPEVTPSIPPRNPQIQSPSYQMFKTPEADERYQVIKENEFIREREFNIVNLIGHRTFEATLKEKIWESLNVMVIKSKNK